MSRFSATPAFRILAWLLLALAAAALAACSMAGSTLLDTANPSGCSGNLGPYYLSRSLLRVEVKKYKDNSDKIAGQDENRHQLQLEGLYREADPSRMYCLDYLQAATSDDLIRVWRNDQGLLQKISSDANDQSAYILKTVIATIFTAFTGLDIGPDGEERAATFGEADDAAPVFSAKFDPTNRERLAIINQQLNSYGFCLLTSAQFQLDRGATSPEQLQAYCEHPLGYLRAHRQPRPPARKALDISEGVVYRPRLPFEVFLLQRGPRPSVARPRGARVWNVTKRKVVLIENDAPAIAARIDRTFFAQRTTTLLFEAGVLKSVQVQKDSELANFVEIPLQIAESIVALPATLVQLRIDQSRGQKNLIEAEKSLMDAHLRRLQQVGGTNLRGDTEMTALQDYVSRKAGARPPVPVPASTPQ